MCHWVGLFALAGSVCLALTLLLDCTAGRGVLCMGSCGCAVEFQVNLCFDHAPIGVAEFLLGRYFGDRGQECV